MLCHGVNIVDTTELHKTGFVLGKYFLDGKLGQRFDQMRIWVFNSVTELIYAVILGI